MDPFGSKRKGDLIPVTSLKRQKGQDAKSKTYVVRASEEGKNRIVDAARERQRFNDSASSSIMKKNTSEKNT